MSREHIPWDASKERLDNAKMVDLLDVNHVEITIDEHNKLWVNVDGKCVLRIGQFIKLDMVNG